MPLEARGGGGVIYLSTKHLGVLKNSFKRVCAFQNELKFGSVRENQMNRKKNLSE